MCIQSTAWLYCCTRIILEPPSCMPLLPTQNALLIRGFTSEYSHTTRLGFGVKSGNRWVYIVFGLVVDVEKNLTELGAFPH